MKDADSNHYQNRCWCTSFRRWQELVVTELAPTHHSRENSQRSLTTHRFTVTLFLRSSLLKVKKIQCQVLFKDQAISQKRWGKKSLFQFL
uniref:Uncharacterized protein n=1 Tax=Acanthochromis polyacanthus TaxID=80966 RepID=A0A3Q1I2H0_9TELE